jgi:hypothetical protein
VNFWSLGILRRQALMQKAVNDDGGGAAIKP